MSYRFFSVRFLLRVPSFIFTEQEIMSFMAAHAVSVSRNVILVPSVNLRSMYRVVFRRLILFSLIASCKLTDEIHVLSSPFRNSIKFHTQDRIKSRVQKIPVLSFYSQTRDPINNINQTIHELNILNNFEMTRT